MTERSCITNHMPDAYACLVTSAHIADCDDEACPGCQPRPATHGRLCESCWFALEHALTDWGVLEAMLAGVDRAVSPESGARPQLGPRLPLSPLDLDFDAIRRTLASRRTLPPYLWVATDTGARDAVRFTRTVNAATPRHPVKEHPRELEHARCPKCRMRTLVYTPAATPGGDALVKCLRCGLTQDYTAFQRLALIEAQCCRRCRPDATETGCVNTGCACHRFAPVPVWQRTARGEYEPYDPTRNPEHAELDPLTLLRVAELKAIAETFNVPQFRQLTKPELIDAIHQAQEAA